MSTCYTVQQNIIYKSREMNTRDYITLLRIKKTPEITKFGPQKFNTIKPY